MTRWIPWLGCALLAGGCSRADDTPAPMPAPAVKVGREPVAPPRPAELTHVTIKALGMYCEESCPVKVRTALAELPQVYELGFDLTKESVFISYDAKLGPAKQVTAPMVAAIKSAGFDPWLAKESWPDGVTAQVVFR